MPLLRPPRGAPHTRPLELSAAVSERTTLPERRGTYAGSPRGRSREPCLRRAGRSRFNPILEGSQQAVLRVRGCAIRLPMLSNPHPSPNHELIPTPSLKPYLHSNPKKRLAQTQLVSFTLCLIPVLLLLYNFVLIMFLTLTLSQFNVTDIPRTRTCRRQMGCLSDCSLQA